MISREIDIINKLGLHARAAAKFVTLASRYESDIQLVRNDQKVNGKSIMSVMMLAVGQGTSLELIADGGDEADALEALEDLVKSRFGEQE
ncbi:MAG: HPr family phosphocarrier protein [Gammaproteobacteria bacterium]|nr:HPr family phosphocarrier protein [Gammaproteobacteria bacterium]